MNFTARADMEHDQGSSMSERSFYPAQAGSIVYTYFAWPIPFRESKESSLTKMMRKA